MKRKKIFLGKKCFFFETIGLLLFSAFTAHADFGYNLLAPFPGAPSTTSMSLAVYLKALFVAGVGLGIVFAVFMIVLGGTQYVMAAVPSSKESGKKKITDALIGLALILSAWVILNTLNPKLLTAGFNLAEVELYTDGSEPTGPDDTGSGNGSTWSPPSSATPGPSGTAGSCGSVHLSGAASNQCGLVSSALRGMLDCMAGKNLNGSVFSISASPIGNDVSKSQSCCSESTYSKGTCKHAMGSCHFGCNGSDKGYSHAVDWATPQGASDDYLCAIAEAAVSCGAANGRPGIWGPRSIKCSNGAQINYWAGHETHLHIPTADCGH